MLRRIALSVAAVLMLSVALHTSSTQAQGAGTLQISPARHDLNLQPGDRQTIEISIKNPGTSNVQVNVVFSDFEPGTDGTPKLLSPEERNEEYGLSSWFTGQTAFSLAPNATHSYVATLTIPDNADAKTRYGVIRFVPADTGESLSASVASIVLADIGDPEFRGSVADFKVIKTSLDNPENASATYEMTVKNDGVFMFTPKLNVNILDSEDTVVASLEPTSIGNVLPDSTRTFAFEWSGQLDSNKTYRAVPLAELPDGTSISQTEQAIILYSAPEPTTEANDQSEADSSSLPIFAIVLAAVAAVGVATTVILMKRRSRGAAQPQATTPADPSVTEDFPTTSQENLRTPSDEEKQQ